MIKQQTDSILRKHRPFYYLLCSPMVEFKKKKRNNIDMYSWLLSHVLTFSAWTCSSSMILWSHASSCRNRSGGRGLVPSIAPTWRRVLLVACSMWNSGFTVRLFQLVASHVENWWLRLWTSGTKPVQESAGLNFWCNHSALSQTSSHYQTMMSIKYGCMKWNALDVYENLGKIMKVFRASQKNWQQNSDILLFCFF